MFKGFQRSIDVHSCHSYCATVTRVPHMNVDIKSAFKQVFKFQLILLTMISKFNNMVNPTITLSHQPTMTGGSY